MDDFVDRELSDDEINKLANEGSDTDLVNSDPSLQDLLNKQADTIRELLDLTGKESPDEVQKLAREFGLKHISAALSEIVDLMVSSDKDAIRLSAAKSIVSIALATTDRDADDKMEALFSKLLEKPSTKKSK